LDKKSAKYELATEEEKLDRFQFICLRKIQKEGNRIRWAQHLRKNDHILNNRHE